MIIVYPGKLFSLEALQSVLSDEDKDQQIYLTSALQENNTLESLIEMAKKQNALKVDDKNSNEKTLLYCVEMSPKTVSSLQEQLSEEYIVCLETLNNHSMTLHSLYQEAFQEALYFQKREELVSLLEKVNLKDLQASRDYFQCYVLACELLKQNELSMNMLETAIQIMRSFQKD